MDAPSTAHAVFTVNFRGIYISRVTLEYLHAHTPCHRAISGTLLVLTAQYAMTRKEQVAFSREISALIGCLSPGITIASQSPSCDGLSLDDAYVAIRSAYAAHQRKFGRPLPTTRSAQYDVHEYHLRCRARRAAQKRLKETT